MYCGEGTDGPRLQPAGQSDWDKIRGKGVGTFATSSHGRIQLCRPWVHEAQPRGAESFAAILAAIGVPQPHLMALLDSELRKIGRSSAVASGPSWFYVEP
jgi:hypothetical protein